MGKTTRKGRKYLWKALGWATLLALWFFLADCALVDKKVILDPFGTAVNIITLGQTIQFWLAILYTCVSAVSSFAFAFLLSFIIALSAYLHSKLEGALRPYISIMRSTPTVAVILVLFLVVDWNFITFIVAFLVTFPILFEGLLLAFRKVPASEIDAAAALGMSRGQILRHIHLDNMKRDIFSSVRATFGLNLKVVIASEVLGIPHTSIGLSILVAKQSFNYYDAWTFLVVAVLLTSLLEWGLTRISGT
ncbi:MAG: ABC transporter permease subunit [Candidatus Ancillula sp.]|jgi:NitT/TauT family transport system permease protein|nr:ABC transporter permease subunit [Candidatus Ancillula sp.]